MFLSMFGDRGAAYLWICGSDGFSNAAGVVEKPQNECEVTVSECVVASRLCRRPLAFEA